MFYKEWEEVKEVKIIDTKFTSQQNFADKKIITERKSFAKRDSEGEINASKSIDGFESAHGLIH